jgi:ABC-2 type transport system ATP-binding protein
MFTLEVDNVYKSYDGVPLLRGVTMRLAPGQVYGVLGPSGAGKSTLLYMLLGFLKPDSGTLRLLGTTNLELMRSRVGYVPQNLRYHLRYSAREYLRYLGQFSGLSGAHLKDRADETLRLVGLHSSADTTLSAYPKTMLQRVGLAQALLAEPDVLLIDDPTAHLDPTGQREVLDVLADIRRRGYTILLATHFLDEIELLCDTVGILFEGRIATEADVQTLRGPGSSAVITIGVAPEKAVQWLQRLSPHVQFHGHEITLRPNSPALQAKVLRTLLDAQIPIVSLQPQGRPLEDLYLHVVRGEPLFADAPVAPVQTEYATIQLDLSRPAAPTASESARPASNGASTPHSDGTPAPAPPGRPRPGQTLLRELLRREAQRRTPPSEQPTNQDKGPSS